VDRIVIALNKSALRTLLLPAAAQGASLSSEQAEDDLIELTLEARVQRRGRAVRLVVTPSEASPGAAPASPALIKVLAQGQRWLESYSQAGNIVYKRRTNERDACRTCHED
jgi:hypothetical protein